MRKAKPYNFPLIVFLVLGFRVLLSFLPSFSIDMGNWIAWSTLLGEVGPTGFYQSPVWTNYTPGFLYYLWTLGLANKVVSFGSQVYPFLIKLPVIFADIAAGLLIYKILKTKAAKFALPAFLLYTLNPALVFSNSIWGQTDGLFALVLLLAAYFLIEKKNASVWGILWALTLLIKPQALFALPIFAFLLLRNFSIKKVFSAALAAIATLFILGLPFFANDPFLGLVKLILKMKDESPFTSVMSFNLWTLITGMWKPDSARFLGITYFGWGTIFALAAILLIIYKIITAFKKTPDFQSGDELNADMSSSFRGNPAFQSGEDVIKKQNVKNRVFKNAIYYEGIGLALLAFFLFPTRVHERYILASFPFLLLSAGLTASRFRFLTYAAMSVLSFVNIYHPYAYYIKDSFLSNQALLTITTSLAPFISVAFLAAFFYLLSLPDSPLRRIEASRQVGKPERLKRAAGRLRFLALAIKRKVFSDARQKSETRNEFVKKNRRAILLAILIFSLASRIVLLGSPSNEYFDEVYHAFTAREMLRGNPAAWEWWNTPPEGFAYEWTHPPLAKEGMVLGMAIFGQNSLGWRLPGAILGVGSVFLIYLLAYSLFKDHLIAVLSAAVFSLDGLPLVMSRIGMNDSYFLFFILLSLYLFVRSKYFTSAFSLGLAAASKWSAVWALPIFIVVHFALKKKFTKKYFWFFILPPLIYFASYIPMFTSGHTIDQFIEVQKQMWWYHTRLEATHPYTSVWWSWPLLVRPIYLYTSGITKGMVANIYAMGNPIVFWTGLGAVVLSAFWAFVEKNKRLGVVIFSYLIFFAPWAVSPRIMFLYHYLPSIPFMAIATGYILRKYPKFILVFMFFSLLVFIYFYPHWSGVEIPVELDKTYYWFPSWR